MDLTGAVVELDIGYVADLFTGLDIDNFLFLKLGKQHKIHPFDDVIMSADIMPRECASAGDVMNL